MEKFWIWLSELRHIGIKTKLLLLENFDSPENIFHATRAELSSFDFLNDKELDTLEQKSLSAAEKIITDCQNKNIHILTFDDPIYPERLKNISDPPLVLYYEGNFPDFSERASICAVGTRNASAYGLLQAKKFGYQIGKCGFILVSGAAKGIDSAAMDGALMAEATVIGVLGNGTDVVYPKSSAQIYRAVKERGCLVSEYPPGTLGAPDHFPARNRIINGLSLGALIIEAPIKSGALITARLAADEGRDVFTIPGNLDCPSLAGNIYLLKKGAIPVENAMDIAREYVNLYPELRTQLPQEENEFSVKTVQEQPDELKTEAAVSAVDWEKMKKNVAGFDLQILQALSVETKTADELIAQLDCAASKFLTATTFLEIRGYLKKLPGQRYALGEKVFMGDAHG